MHHSSSVAAPARPARLLWLLLAALQAAMPAGSAGSRSNHNHVAGLRAALQHSQDLAAGPKIYIYPPPAPAANPYRHVECHAASVKSPTGPLAFLDSYRWEHLLPQHLAVLPTHVTDPAAADLFFIPHNTTCYIKHQAEPLLPPNPQWDTISEQYVAAKHAVFRTYLEPYLQQVRQAPHFRKRNGADHAIAVGEEHGLCSGSPWDGLVAMLGGVIVLHVNGMDERNPAAAANMFWPSNVGCFRPERDIVVPPFAPHTHLTHHVVESGPGGPPSAWMQHQQHQHQHQHRAPPTPAARPTLAYFGGSAPNHKKNWPNPPPEYGSGARSMLMLMADDARNAAGRRLLVHTPNPPSSVRQAAMNDSLFCLCLGGHAVWSVRPYDCWAAGSLPVHVTDGFAMPFERYIPYRSMSVKIAQSGMAFLVRLLESFVQAPGGEVELGRRVALGYGMLPFLLWTGDPRSNAAAMVVLELACQRFWVGERRAAAPELCSLNAPHGNYMGVAWEDWL